jgi:hypothetical protein
MPSGTLMAACKTDNAERERAVQLLQQVPPILYIVEDGSVSFEALARAQAPSAHLSA